MSSLLKKVYQKVLPEKIRGSKLIRNFKKNYCVRFKYNHFFDKYDWHEVRVSLGKENPDKTFFVIRKVNNAVGLLSCYLTALTRLLLNEEKSYIPVMDMETHYYKLIDAEKDKNKKVNAWEHYFMPLSDYSMDDVRRSRDVIFSEGVHTPQAGLCLFNKTKVTEDILKPFYKIDKKYFKLRPHLVERFEKKHKELFMGKRVMGTMIRDDYFFLAAGREQKAPEYNTHPGIEWHPKQPTPWELCDIVEEKMKKYKCDYIFVIAETSYSLNVFKQRFGEKLLHSGRAVKQIDELDFSKFRKSAIKYNEENLRVNSNIDYLEEIYLLSKCTSLTAAKCSGSVVAALWNQGKYEHMDILQLGVY